MTTRPEDDAVLDLLLEVVQELDTAPDLVTGLQRAADRLRKLVDYDTMGVLLLDDLGHELSFELAVGFPPEVVEHWRFGLGQGIVGTAAKTKKTVFVEDVQADPRYIDGGVGIRSEVAVPLLVKGRAVGVLDLGCRRPGAFSPSLERILGHLGSHLARAIENRRLVANTREQARTLSLLHEVNRELVSILDRRELLGRVAELVQRLIDYDRFTVRLWNERTQVLESWISLRRDGVRGEGEESIPLGHGLSGTAAALRQPIRAPNVHLDPRFVRASETLEIQSELAVPLIFKDRLVGVVDLESTEYDAFRPRHEQLLSTLASSLAIALENARLYEQLQRRERSIERDLSTARTVQRQLLPDAVPTVPGLEIGVAWEPAKHLGGDFYDFLPYGDDRIGIAVGDVAGKATAAALYGAMAVGMLREHALEKRLGPAEILEDMNGKLRQLGIEHRFLAMVFAVYTPSTRMLEIASSGLPHPWLLRPGRADPIRVAGVPLGLLPDRTYESQRVVLEPGMTVVIATDGFEEINDRNEQEFGRVRLESELTRLSTSSARTIARELLQLTTDFATDTTPFDDRTAVILRALGDDEVEGTAGDRAGRAVEPVPSG